MKYIVLVLCMGVAVIGCGDTDEVDAPQSCEPAPSSSADQASELKDAGIAVDSGK